MAPSFFLFGVPSSSIIRWSTAIWSSASMPISSSAIVVVDVLDGLRARPCRGTLALSPSRSSQASCTPVLAPLGTAARPTEPSSSVTSTSTVGLPRLSRIWRPWMSTIVLMAIDLPFRECAVVLTMCALKPSF